MPRLGLRSPGATKRQQFDLRKLTRPVASLDLEELEHEAFLVELADKRAAPLLPDQHMLGHHFINGTADGADGDTKTFSQLGLARQTATGRHRARDNVGHQLLFDVAVQHHTPKRQPRASPPRILAPDRHPQSGSDR